MKVAATVLILALIPAAAFAQERRFTITLPEGQLNYVGGILAKQPYEKVAPIIEAIQAQVQAQIKRAQDAQQNRKESKP